MTEMGCIMAYAYDGAGALDYFPCRYGTSRHLFRGPGRAFEGDYIAALGGSETYGRFIETPWPALVEQALGRPVVNLGILNAGIDAYLDDPASLAVAAGAGLRLVQVMGAVNLNNRFYRVHPRRNDRLIAATADLHKLYPEIDFTEFNFTRHLIKRLMVLDGDRFDIVVRELQAAWRQRMLRLLADTGGPTRLLWFAECPPPGPDQPWQIGQGMPPLVDRRMLDQMRPLVEDMIEVVPPRWGGSLEGKRFDPLQVPAALALPGPKAHDKAARAVVAAIKAPGVAIAGPRRARRV